jgi:hypothetical protein
MEIKKKARWTDHLNAAEASGMGIAAYAAQHGIKPHVLYKLRYKFRRSAARRRSEQSAFVPVKVTRSPAQQDRPTGHGGKAVDAPVFMQARLANGVVLNWSHDPTRPQALSSVLHTLAGLPCFG